MVKMAAAWPPKKFVSYHKLHPEDGGSMTFRNIDILPQYYTLKMAAA
jgi:hypothetical protein